ncbi:hypothetical protein CVT26_010630 [Gymnopilus dilepis]|uniref:Uncharacterized protein n=1 Tax=Gymnopilus dilepis TaxID=231916 RepID=A0A409W527_9AGAR|nr:hypothetical protein CVT26_010630 [Gymnopilus dilepis]
MSTDSATYSQPTSFMLRRLPRLVEHIIRLAFKDDAEATGSVDVYKPSWADVVKRSRMKKSLLQNT